ncbi:MAG: hypothetical protein EA409_00470 [Saprospirales bacterium]|nr:MAG: hypothetical protein EA409_00470 [Saprospirales bacterium]
MWKLIVLPLAVLVLIGCQGEGSGSDQQSPTEQAPQPVETPQQQEQQQPQMQPPQEVNIPAGADGIVHHYICVDQCEGGHSEQPGFCPVCNKQLAHNQAWHTAQNQQMQQQPQMQQNGGDPRQQIDPMRGGQTPQNQMDVQQQPMEQVNIPAGPDGVVHHYICTNSCEGGHSESPGVCPVCSQRLAHNQAWHNQ